MNCNLRLRLHLSGVSLIIRDLDPVYHGCETGEGGGVTKESHGERGVTQRERSLRVKRKPTQEVPKQILRKGVG